MCVLLILIKNHFDLVININVNTLIATLSEIAILAKTKPVSNAIPFNDNGRIYFVLTGGV